MRLRNGLTLVASATAIAVMSGMALAPAKAEEVTLKNGRAGLAADAHHEGPVRQEL
jgi:hypothetical protein